MDSTGVLMSTVSTMTERVPYDEFSMFGDNATE